MTTKQAKTAEITVEQLPVAPPNNGNSQANNLFISVATFDAEGKTVGGRIVDMHHFGTRKWLEKHLWWSTHHGYLCEINIATQVEIDTYLAEAKIALAEKFNSQTAEAVAA